MHRKSEELYGSDGKIHYTYNISMGNTSHYVWVYWYVENRENTKF